MHSFTLLTFSSCYFYYFFNIWVLVDRVTFYAGVTHCLYAFPLKTRSWLRVRTLCWVCVFHLPASPHLTASLPLYLLLLLVLSLGFSPGKQATHSFSLKPGSKRGAAAGAGLTSPGAHYPWSSPGCLFDRRVCWNIHVLNILRLSL